MRVLISITVILFVLVSRLSGQEFTVMFYNVENLFDTVNDTAKNDEEFLPGGERRWTVSRYYRKLNSIARTVVVAGEWELPALIGFCEVENVEVLKDLAYGTLLSAGNYGIVHRDSPDARGIDLALLYRRESFEVSEVRSWLLESTDSIPVLTRNLLYVKVTASGDTLHLILCHLPSRRGGILAASALRERMARLAAEKADSLITATAGKAAVIIMGDFNSTPDDPLMDLLTKDSGFVSLSASEASQGKGSYRYQGTWEMIDQVLVSHAMTDSSAVWHVHQGCLKVVDAPFLLTEDETYPGKKPFPTYGGYRYSGGYSDHLPVVIRINHSSKVSDPGSQASSFRP